VSIAVVDHVHSYLLGRLLRAVGKDELALMTAYAAIGLIGKVVAYHTLAFA
jgi:hypothetical protein